MINLFKSSRLASFILIPLLVLLFNFLNFISHKYLFQETIDIGMWGKVSYLPYANIAAGILLVIHAFLLNFIFNKNEFLDRNYFIPGMVYTVYMSFFHSFYVLDGLLLAHTFCLLAIQQLYILHQNTDARKTVYNIGFLVGAAASFHPPLLLSLPFFMIMTLVIRPFVLREFFLLIFGYATPLVYAFSFQIYYGYQLDLKLVHPFVNHEQKQLDFLITSIIFTILTMLSFWALRLRMTKSSIRIKKLIRIQWFFIALALGIGFTDLFMYNQIERFSLLLIPVAFFASFTFWNQLLEPIAKVIFYLSFIYSILKFFL